MMEYLSIGMLEDWMVGWMMEYWSNGRLYERESVGAAGVEINVFRAVLCDSVVKFL